MPIDKIVKIGKKYKIYFISNEELYNRMNEAYEKRKAENQKSFNKYYKKYLKNYGSRLENKGK